MMASGFFFTFPILLLVLTIPVSAADSDLYTGIRSLNNTEHYLGVNPLLPIISIEDQKSAKNFIVTSDLRSSSITTNKEKYLLQDFQTSTIDTRINPDELVYLGAFRVPMPEGEEYGWAYGGGGLTYYPSGDPLGGADGHPGSLFGMGHDQQNRITEINIPKPIISLQKKTSDLYMAQTIQPFVNLNTGIFTDSGQGAPLRGDVCFLPRQGNQESDKLYFTFAEHLEFDLVSSLAWSNLQLRAPSVQGPWKIGNYSNFCTNDYLLEIPLSWARQNLPDYRLASGRFRDGSLGGSGPSLFALAPWLDGNPPSKNSILKHVRPLILYEKEYEGSSHVMNGYTNADEWSGGAWITAGTKSAIIFVGTKGRGECWYGFSDGTIWPDDPPYPPIPPPPHNERGWWAERFEGVIYFYDPTDITSVVEGVQPTYYPQPYAELNIDQFLYHITGDKQKRHLGAIAYNREQGFIYISEFQGDGDACLIHVWKIQNSLPKTDNIGIFRGKVWYVDYNGNGYWDAGDKSAAFGVGDGRDIPVTGDWNGDGKTNIGAVRGKTWYADFNRNGYWDTGDKSAVFGVGDGKDIPVIGKWHGNSGASVQ